MARSKRPQDIQSRNFKLLLFPDNHMHMDVLVKLPQLYDDYIGILHKGQDGKKDHYHLCFRLDKPYKLGTIARSLGFLDDLGEPDLQFLRVLDGRLSRFLVYLTHLDCPEKEQYNASELFGSSSMLAEYGKAATKFMRNEFDMADCVLACLDWIQSQHENIIRMTSFARWICSTPYFKAASSPLVRECIAEHNQRIYDASRSVYIERMQEGSERMQAILQYPASDPAPPVIPDDLCDDWGELL